MSRTTHPLAWDMREPMISQAEALSARLYRRARLVDPDAKIQMPDPVAIADGLLADGRGHPAFWVERVLDGIAEKAAQNGAVFWGTPLGRACMWWGPSLHQEVVTPGAVMEALRCTRQNVSLLNTQGRIVRVDTLPGGYTTASVSAVMRTVYAYEER
jgi:hypothetical protein